MISQLTWCGQGEDANDHGGGSGGGDGGVDGVGADPAFGGAETVSEDDERKQD